METRGRKKKILKYLHLESSEVVKVEKVDSKSWVAHLSGGLERITRYEMENEYKYLGEWSESNVD